MLHRYLLLVLVYQLGLTCSCFGCTLPVRVQICARGLGCFVSDSLVRCLLQMCSRQHVLCWSLVLFSWCAPAGVYAATLACDTGLSRERVANKACLCVLHESTRNACLLACT